MCTNFRSAKHRATRSSPSSTRGSAAARAIQARARCPEALLALTMSMQYDKAKGRWLADAGARALGQISLARADAEHGIYLALTDAQGRSWS